MRLRADRRSATPIGDQLAAQLRGEIAAGRLRPGDRLPSLRAAAAEAGVHLNTVRSVYARLEAEGLVTTTQGRGTYVAQLAPAMADERRALHREIERLAAELLAAPAASGVSAPAGPSGPPRLLTIEELTAARDLLAQHLGDLRAVRTAAEQSRDAAARDAAPDPAPRPSPARMRWSGA
ncbi:MAG: GntR family transcriptional regulator [Solirubrobacterales bacterium]|nr:GntR family transcriptional regulator [Solirubrobacterales bacterium]